MEVLRNVTQAEDISRPAVALNDGMEEPLISQSPNSLAPLVVKMRVAVLVFTKSDLAAWRIAVIKAVSTDAAIKEAVGGKGQFHYDGCEVGFSTAERIAVDLAVYFEFTYVLSLVRIDTEDRRADILDAIATALEGITPP
jgi:hypothetical protein